MGESREREGFFGKYTEHFDDDGNKIGESREREGLFGDYIEHTDTSGNKIGESREREGFFGDYTEHTDTSGSKIGESREREGIFGDYTEHTNTSGSKVGESREREGFFGDYTEHTGSVPYQYSPRRQKSRDPLSDAGTTPPPYNDSYDSDSDSYDSSDRANHYSSESRVASTSHVGSKSISLVPILVIAAMVAAALIGWGHYKESEGQYAAAKQEHLRLISLAQASVNSRRFDEAENYYAKAYELSAELDQAHKQGVLTARAANYTRLQVAPNSSTAYPVQGSVWTRFDNPLKCRNKPKSCGYHFKPGDQGQIFRTGGNVTITTTAGEAWPIRDGMRIADIFPLGSDLCCFESQDSAVPRLTFTAVSNARANIYIVRQ